MMKTTNNPNIWFPKLPTFNPLALADLQVIGSYITSLPRKILLLSQTNELYIAGINLKFINKQSLADFIARKPEIESRFYELLIDLIDYTTEISTSRKHIEIEHYRDPDDEYESIILRVCVDLDFKEILRIWDDISLKLSKPNDSTDFFIEVLDPPLCRTSLSTKYTM